MSQRRQSILVFHRFNNTIGTKGFVILLLSLLLICTTTAATTIRSTTAINDVDRYNKHDGNSQQQIYQHHHQEYQQSSHRYLVDEKEDEYYYETPDDDGTTGLMDDFEVIENTIFLCNNRLKECESKLLDVLIRCELNPEDDNEENDDNNDDGEQEVVNESNIHLIRHRLVQVQRSVQSTDNNNTTTNNDTDTGSPVNGIVDFVLDGIRKRIECIRKIRDCEELIDQFFCPSKSPTSNPAAIPTTSAPITIPTTTVIPVAVTTPAPISNVPVSVPPTSIPTNIPTMMPTITCIGSAAELVVAFRTAPTTINATTTIVTTNSTTGSNNTNTTSTVPPPPPPITTYYLCPKTTTIHGSIVLTNPIDVTNKNIALNCLGDIGSLCIISGQNTTRLFMGAPISLSYTSIQFMNGSAIVVDGTSTNTVGGAFHLTSGRTIFRHCSFHQNVATRGGAIYASGFTTILQLFTTTFMSNKAVLNAGAIYSQGASIEISNSYFFRNLAKVNGGCIYALDPALFQISNTIFNESRAGASGGVVFLDRGEMDAINTTFFNNSASLAFGGGGALTLFRAVSFLSNSVFSNNLAFEGFDIYIEDEATATIGSQLTCDPAIPVVFCNGLGGIDGNTANLDDTNCGTVGTVGTPSVGRCLL